MTVNALAALGGAVLLAACSSASATTRSNAPAGPRGSIDHIVIVMQENRSPDNLFHGLPGADIANSGLNSQGQTIALAPIPMVGPYDLGHGHPAFEAVYDGGKMDGADLNAPICGNVGPHCQIPPNPQYGYVPPNEVAEYFTLAERYTFADRMFQTNQGESYPAHQMIIAGTSAPKTGSNLFVSENPVNGTGCHAFSYSYVVEIDPKGNESQHTYPCFEHATLMDLLDARGLPWRYYANDPTSIWNAPNSIKHLRDGPDWSKDVVVPQSRVIADVQNGTLGAVTWVNPDVHDSDHAAVNDGTGPAWVAAIVNTIGKSAYWQHTAIFITWDDWGGWYDHVAPPIANSYEYGFRVPLIVVSPYAKRGYVSHVTHDFGSILKFAEKTFGLPSLGYADAPADDLSDCFDFAKRPARFVPVPARYPPAYFVRRAPSRAPIDND